MFHYLIYGQPEYAKSNQDCKFNYLKLAVALNYLGDKEFDDNFLNEIRKDQMGTYYQKYKFDIITKRESLKFETIELTLKFDSILKLLDDNDFCINHIFPFWFEKNNLNTKIVRVINEQKNTALVDVINKSGCRVSRSTIVIKLLNGNLCEVAKFN